MTIPSPLVAAYRQALYRVDAGRIGGCVCSGFDLQVDRASPGLLRLLDCAQQPCAALITADNPGSERQSRARNDEQRRQLGDLIEALALPYLETRSLDPDQHWPPEHGVLILGMTLDRARDIGAQFGQNAVLWCDRDAVPQLILLV